MRLVSTHLAFRPSRSGMTTFWPPFEANSGKRPDARMTGPTILVVDDENTVRHVVGRMLRAGGFALLEATDGREALQVVQQREHPPDLILTDVVMPLLNGGELASRVRAIQPDQRVLLMSAYALEDLRRQGLYPEELPFVQKPFTAEQLVRAVRSALS
jgi:two-component system cell cycle sensor histidine kinase/response regulator CckA